MIAAGEQPELMYEVTLERQFRNIFFTLHNYAGNEIQKFRDWSMVRFASIGREICPTTGGKHLQGYIEFHGPVRFSTIVNKFPQIWLQYRRGTVFKAVKYTQKDKDFEEWGVCSHQGKVSPIRVCCDMISDGATMQDIARADPECFVRNAKGFRDFKNTLINERTTVPEVVVLYGPTGTGKSHKAQQMCGSTARTTYRWCPGNEKWFDDYVGQKNVILDEFRGQLSFDYLKCLFDRYACRVQYKHGSCEFAATKIYITSPVHPSFWYPDLDYRDGDINQLLRRITTITHMTKVYTGSTK